MSYKLLRRALKLKAENKILRTYVKQTIEMLEEIVEEMSLASALERAGLTEDQIQALSTWYTEYLESL